MDLDYSTLSFALLGVLFGIIFVSDGWLSYQGSDQSFARSPKVRGILYILGGGVIPVIRELTQETTKVKTNSITIYTFFVTVSILFILLVLCLYAFLISFKRLRKVNFGDSLLETIIEALPFVTVALQEGNKKFNEEIENRLVPKNIKQRNDVMEFLSSAYNDLCTYNNDLRKTNADSLMKCQEFANFIAHYLEEFIDIFLDSSKVNYRACVYYLDKDANQLLFLAGFSPQISPYTREKLPVEDSLAGYAIKNPYIAHLFYTDKRSNSLPFYVKRNPRRYNSVVSCAIKHPEINENSLAKMALCIDCIYGKSNSFIDFEYISRMIVILSIVFANAQVLMSIDNEGIEQYIKNQG
jgi:hypothetical protein